MNGGTVTVSGATKITDGIGNALFGAAFPCTRAQIVTFLYRAFAD